MSMVVAGIDLSQTGLGLVAVQGDWDLQWDRFARATVGYGLAKDCPPWQAIGRLGFIADKVVAFLREQAVTHVWIEGYPVGGRTFGFDKVAEIGGVVRFVLMRELDLYANTAQLTTARKLLLGKLPRSDTKTVVAETVRSFDHACQAWTGDEIDAWVALNYGMSLMNRRFVATPQPPAAPPRRSRKAKSDDLP